MYESIHVVFVRTYSTVCVPLAIAFVFKFKITRAMAVGKAHICAYPIRREILLGCFQWEPFFSLSLISSWPWACRHTVQIRSTCGTVRSVHYNPSTHSIPSINQSISSSSVDTLRHPTAGCAHNQKLHSSLPTDTRHRHLSSLAQCPLFCLKT